MKTQAWEVAAIITWLGRFDLAALVQPHLKFLFVCLFITHNQHTSKQHTSEALYHAVPVQLSGADC